AVAELALQRLQRLGPAARQHHLGAGAVQRAGDGGTDAARGAGDQRVLSIEIEHGVSCTRCESQRRGQSVRTKASMSAGPWMETPVSSGSMRRTSPVKTLPEPISTSVSTPLVFR